MMKHIISLWLAALLLVAQPIQAAVCVGFGGCVTPTIGSLWNEGFELVGTEHTVSIGSDNGTFDFDYTLDGTPPDGSCSEGFRYISDTGTENNGYITIDIGGAVTYPATIYLSIYVKSVSMGGGFFRIIQFDDNTTKSSIGVFTLAYFGSRLDIFAADGQEPGLTNNVTTGNWYEIVVELDETAASGGSSWTVNGVSQGTFTRYNAAGRYIHIGAVDGKASTEDVDFVVGYLYVDN